MRVRTDDVPAEHVPDQAEHLVGLGHDDGGNDVSFTTAPARS